MDSNFFVVVVYAMDLDHTAYVQQGCMLAVLIRMMTPPRKKKIGSFDSLAKCALGLHHHLELLPYVSMLQVGNCWAWHRACSLLMQHANLALFCTFQTIMQLR